MDTKTQQVINDQRVSIATKKKRMSVEIRSTDDDNRFFVNGKTVLQDIDGDWISKPELTPVEKDFFVAFLRGLPLRGLGGT